MYNKMASSLSINMEAKLREMIKCIATKFEFDANKAFEHVSGHVEEILTMAGCVVEKKPEAKEPEAKTGDDEKIAECKKNIALWEKKLADGKVKDTAKQEEKIAKEKAKLAKLEAKAPAPAPVEKKEEPPKAEPVDKKEKRIKRFSPVMTTQLKKALEEVGVEVSDKVKKEFQQYIEDLSDDDYRGAGLAEHMRMFAKQKTPVEKPAVEDDGGSNARGGGPTHVPTAADAPRVLTLVELQSIKTTASVEPTGTFWDCDDGRFVTGPATDADEEVTETEFNGKKYAVGDKTGRVYEIAEDKDIFAGFIGVGKFKDMKMV